MTKTKYNIKPICYLCKRDYTKKDDVGGIIFSDLLICPKCVVKVMTSAKKFKSEGLVSMRAHEKEKFRNLARRYERSLPILETSAKE